MARPDTIGYRAAKFVRRNRVSVSAAILALAAIIAGSVVAIYQARIAQQRFQQVRKLAHTFVFDLHDEIANLEGSTKARQMMVRTGLEYLDNLAKNAGGNLDLQSEIAAAYMKIGDAEGNPNKSNLGQTADAVASYRKAGDIYQRIAASNATYLPDLATYYFRYAGLLRFTPDLKGARELSNSAIQTLDRVRGNQSMNAQLESIYVKAWCTLGDLDGSGAFRQAQRTRDARISRAPG
jgi:tetratricopeptide (TPR) repeat protein